MTCSTGYDPDMPVRLRRARIVVAGVLLLWWAAIGIGLCLAIRWLAS